MKPVWEQMREAEAKKDEEEKEKRDQERKNIETQRLRDLAYTAARYANERRTTIHELKDWKP